MSHVNESFSLSYLPSGNLQFFSLISSHSSRVAPITKCSLPIGRDKRRRERRIRCVGVSRKDSSEQREDSFLFLYYVTFKREKKKLKQRKNRINEEKIQQVNYDSSKWPHIYDSFLLSYDITTVIIIRFMILIARGPINGPDITAPVFNIILLEKNRFEFWVWTRD